MTPVRLIQPVSVRENKKLRVAAYCRVSTDSIDQQASYKNQITYYTEFIQKQHGWELEDIYADEGISGTQTCNRPEFQRMIRACREKQIDLIITKSMSRFARNITETLKYTRELKHLGIGVIFEKEHINTLTLADEMLFSMLSTLSQEESASISKNVRLSITKRMATGDYVDVNAPYGYRIENNKLVIYEPEARVVRCIYERYLSGWSAHEIAGELTEKNIPTKMGKDKWRASKISYILSNERYIGDCKYQKTFREPIVPFKQSINRGEEDMYYATDTHEPLIEKEIFEKVQILRESRKQQYAKNDKLNRYPLTGRILCSECGSLFHRKVRGDTTKWVCAKHFENARECTSNYYDEDRIYDGLMTMLNKLRFGESQIITQVIQRLQKAAVMHKRNNIQAMDISEEIAKLNRKLCALSDLRAKGYMANDVYETQFREIKKQISLRKSERQDALSSHIVKMLEEMRRLQTMLNEIEEPLEIFDEKFLYEIIKKIEINRRDEMTVTLIGNLKFTERI